MSDLKAALLEVSGGKGIDGSIDATGRPEVLKALLNASGKGKVTVGVGKVSPCSFITSRSFLSRLSLTPTCHSLPISFISSF